MAADLISWDNSDEGTAVRRFFFRDAGESTPTEVVRWWEKRRLPFNAAVGATGVVSLAAANLLNLIGPGGGAFIPPLVAIVAYGTLANVMYTGGWITELAIRPLFGRKAPVVGATLFRYGFAFAVGVTLLPVVVTSVGLVFRLLGGVLR